MLSVPIGPSEVSFLHFAGCFGGRLARELGEGERGNAY